MADRSYRTADPYRDTDVIDARAPRANQLVVGVVALAGALTGLWWLPLLMAAAARDRADAGPALVPGLRRLLRAAAAAASARDRWRTRGRRGSPTWSAWSCCRRRRWRSWPASSAVGAALALLVAALALLSAATGFCAGCQMYKLWARVRGLGHGHGHIERIEPADVGGTLGLQTVVQFTHPLCSDCHRLERELRAAGRDVVTVDVRRQPDLARKYGVGVVPTAVAVDASGTVLARLA